jgi:beta-glucosidase
MGGAALRVGAREAVRKSLVLLKNKNQLLPLAKDLGAIFVGGSKAHDLGHQAGGWTVAWQGGSGRSVTGTTILEGIQAAAGANKVTYNREGFGVAGHDLAIVVVGEKPYAEGYGDRSHLALADEDLICLRRIYREKIPLIVIVVSGRPLIVTEELERWDALIAAWLPGTEGQGVSDVLFGDHDFVGRLPLRWPKAMGQLPFAAADPAAPAEEPLFPYGFGLSYRR